MKLSCMAVFLMIAILSISAAGQEQCIPFGGTIYGWHNDKAWYGEGDFSVGRKTMHASVVDTNTGVDRYGNMWLGTETAVFDFGGGDKIELLTQFVTEHHTDAVAKEGLFHVNEIGSFANGTGRFKNAWGHFSSQGPFGPGVTLPPTVKAGPNDGMFWIGQYNGMICGVKQDAKK